MPVARNEWLQMEAGGPTARQRRSHKIKLRRTVKTVACNPDEPVGALRPSVRSEGELRPGLTALGYPYGVVRVR
jgi:hypothetical protein